ncbi:MAG: hypothetical protein GXO07_05015 [Crenarchaeota archaeon]|nr:hypothetical protein [Thermoproteota archaeon]
MSEVVKNMNISITDLKRIEKELEKGIIMADRKMVVALYEGLEKVIGTANAFIYNIIKKVAKERAKELRREGILKAEEALDAALKMLKDYGYAEELQVVREGEKLLVRGRGLLFGSSLKGKRKPVDSAVAGFLAGWLEGSWERRVDVKELRCEAKGDPHCEFEVRAGPST